MRILVLGDVGGEPRRRLIQRLIEAHLRSLRRECAVDFMVVNGEQEKGSGLRAAP